MDFIKRYIYSLEEETGGIEHVPREQAYFMLKFMSGEDWGYDVDAWLSRVGAIRERLRITDAECDPDAK